MEGSLLVLGNLLLDMIAPVEDAYLEVNNLIPDSIQTAKENHFQIYKEILEKKDVVISPGGSALNTVRMAQRILGIPNSIALLGAVSSDETGKLLVDTVEKEGIKMLVQYVKNVPTGRCACLLTKRGSARTMVTDLGAALNFSHETFMDSEIDCKWLDEAKFVYISGYFLKVSPVTAMEVAKKMKRRNVPVLLNLNAVWVTTSCKQDIQALLPYVDVLFGNEAEITSFAGEICLTNPMENNLPVSATKVASALSSFILKQKTGSRSDQQNILVLMTRDNLVDTTGAGDAFVGGFLANYIQKKSLDECISCGIWAATEELKGYGFILPSEIPKQFQSTPERQ